MFVYKALSGLQQAILVISLCVFVPLLTVPRCCCKSKADRAFSVAGPKLWNSSPYHAWSAPSLDIFKSTLKSYFYSSLWRLLFVLWISACAHYTALWIHLYCLILLMLSMSNAEMLIHAFMTSRLDYCNALVGGCSARLTLFLKFTLNF